LDAPVDVRQPSGTPPTIVTRYGAAITDCRWMITFASSSWLPDDR